uniref:Phosphoribulokinase/uridine kinase domain-containing protein n=1 Tax=Arion vulgaris TaxID=1028688 RepID=A0A0B7B5V9_9EUPU
MTKTVQKFVSTITILIKRLHFKCPYYQTGLSTEGINQMSDKKYIIVGIGGATNSGKSTTSSMLCKVLPHSEWICQDNYFLEPDDPHVEITDGYQNWDTLSSLKIDMMIKDVKDWIKRQQNNTGTSILIVEGFLLFNVSELTTLFEKKYFITISKEICVERRKQREYNPPDTPGYFDKIVWPSYLQYLDALQSQNDIEYIDGHTDLETIYKTILNKIETALQKEPVNGIMN